MFYRCWHFLIIFILNKRWNIANFFINCRTTIYVSWWNCLYSRLMLFYLFIFLTALDSRGKYCSLDVIFGLDIERTAVKQWILEDTFDLLVKGRFYFSKILMKLLEGNWFWVMNILNSIGSIRMTMIFMMNIGTMIDSLMLLAKVCCILTHFIIN